MLKSQLKRAADLKYGAREPQAQGVGGRQLRIDAAHDGVADIFGTYNKPVGPSRNSRMAGANRFRASLLWLVKNNAITQIQADRLDLVRTHRDDLVHELIKYVIDPEADPDVELLVDAISTLKDLHRFWINVELSTGGFFLPDGSDAHRHNSDGATPIIASGFDGRR